MNVGTGFIEEEAGAVGNCPQCGGEGGVELGERVFRCGYCKTGLYIATPGPLVYRLPLEDRYKGREVVYLPFWRLKGLRYKVKVETGEVEANLLDATAPAMSLMPKKANLGVRPQAWRLILTNWLSGAPAADVKLEEAVDEGAADRIFGGASEILLTRLIGEVSYLILAPFIVSGEGERALIEGAFPDGPKYWVTVEQARELIEAGKKAEPPEPMKFIPLLCPNCAAALPSQKGAEILLCPSCAEAWWPHGGSFRRMPSAVLGDHERGERLFPFWQIDFVSEKLGISTRADMARVALPYRILQEEMTGEHSSAVIPGFKVPPRIFLRMARMATLFFTGEHKPARPEKGSVQSEPVRLPLREAVEFLPVLMSSVVMDKKNRLPLMPEADFRIERARLLYIPFVLDGREWKHLPSGQVIPENVVLFGANL